MLQEKTPVCVTALFREPGIELLYVSVPDYRAGYLFCFNFLFSFFTQKDKKRKDEWEKII